MANEMQHGATVWSQIGGDVNAATVSAIFARWNEYNEYEIVQVDYLPDASDEFKNEENPYSIQEFTFDMSYLSDRDMVAAINACGMPADYEWTVEAKFLALFEFGKRDPRQPSTYFDEYGDQMPTLKMVMDDYDIPASALWRPEEYNEVPTND